MDSLSDHATTGNLTPRPYQLEGIARARAAMARGIKRLLLVMATGGGKTVVAALIAHGVLAKQRRALFLAHRREIIAQTWAKLVEAGIPAAQVGVIMADGRITHPVTRERFDARQRNAPMQVASVQTLVGRALPPADVVFADECHHARAKSWQTILDHYTAAGARIVGLTATPIRQDGRGLGELFEELLVVQSFRELAAQGYLVVPRVYTHPRLPDLSGVHTVAGEYQQDEVAAAVDTPGLVGDVVEHWISHAEGRSTIVFAASVEHSQHLAAAFLAAGVRAEHIDAKTPAIERDGILGRLADGTTRVLANMGVCTEGYDCPRAKCIVLARPTQSLGLYLQMCLDEQTEILTPRGFVGPDEIRDDDLVAGFDMDTSEVSWQPILSRVDRRLHALENMYAARGPGVDIRVTNQHGMVVKPRCRPWPTRWRLADAERIARYDAMRIPCAGFQRSAGLPLSDDEIRFIGWFLTDGTLHRTTHAISISQSDHQPQIENLRRCLHGCGFKVSEYHIEPRGFASGRPQTRFVVCRGKPRGRDKHLRGWESLAIYIDKDLSPALESLGARQLGLLLEAIHDGDGRKARYSAAAGWQSHSYHITSIRRLFVDRLQSLCVRRGWRCNVSVWDPPLDHPTSKQRQYTLHIKHQDFLTLRGTGSGGTRFTRVEAAPDERVWCVETPLGTIITRRNGKIAIVGNSGRGLRPWNDTPAVLLDHAGNALRHGLPQEDRGWSLTMDRKKAARVPSPKICPACQLTWPQGTTYCDPAQGGCGHTWERAERDGPDMHEGELAELTEAAREEQRRATARKNLAREVWRLACRRAGIAGWARTESDRARAEVESRGLNGTLYRLFGKRDRLSAAALREALAYVTRAGVREPGEEG